MNERTERRTQLDLTQADAARKAGLSLATWRRWEEDPESVRAKTRSFCERVLAANPKRLAADHALAELHDQVDRSWRDRPDLTPRQAHAIAMTLDGWADLDIAEWLENPDHPLHDVSPFAYFDLRVMMLVNENRAWAAAVQQRCRTLSEEVSAGTIAFDRPGCYMDELLLGTALPGAQAFLDEMPELFDAIAPRPASEDSAAGTYILGDNDWDLVSDGWDDICRWDDWEVPLRHGHPLLPAVLAERHPFTWLDVTEPTGPGYLQRLSGMIVEASSHPTTTGGVQ